MNDWNYRRSANSVQLLAELGQRLGLSMAHCLQGTGLAAAQLQDPQLEIEASQELQLVRNLQALLPRHPALGLQSGLEYQLTAYGLFGFAIISSPTFRSAVRTGLSYMELSFIFCRLRVEEQGGEFHLVLEDGAIPEDVRDFLLERDAAAIRLIQQELFGEAMPLLRLEWRGPRPAHAAEFQRVFGVMPRFGCASSRMIMDAKLIDQPLPRANLRTAQLCETQCRDLLQKRKARTGIASIVRNHLLAAPADIPAMERLARRLHMTPRTLRRKLDAEGTSYRALVDEIREALAEELLRAGSLSVEEVAGRLGYAESSSFIHAFQRWKGVSPGSLRG